jgi:hypothetical protein
MRAFERSFVLTRRSACHAVKELAHRVIYKPTDRAGFIQAPDCFALAHPPFRRFAAGTRSFATSADPSRFRHSIAPLIFDTHSLIRGVARF